MLQRKYVKYVVTLSVDEMAGGQDKMPEALAVGGVSSDQGSIVSSSEGSGPEPS